MMQDVYEWKDIKHLFPPNESIILYNNMFVRDYLRDNYDLLSYSLRNKEILTTFIEDINKTYESYFIINHNKMFRIFFTMNKNKILSLQDFATLYNKLINIKVFA